MRASLAAVAIGFLLVGSALAEGVPIYEHNGSVIRWQKTGDDILAVYSTIRPGMEGAGVERGTPLFRGAYRNGQIIGRAYAFKAGCPAASYEVVGRYIGNRIVLRGAAPHRAPHSCAVVGYFADSPHAQLVFTYTGTLPYGEDDLYHE